ncbi:MAG: S1 RNA-binding domain-containing protein [Clostridiaceae bacterium]|jgi:S1 RNA binding domain protein|nr:S1 RNA-binding domain-containing protein [Clostridiaceae bacterium]
MEVEVGNIVDGRVTGITKFGAFVQMSNGKTGLVHISEIALDYVKDIAEHLKVDDVVKVKVISVDESGKVSLSIKKALEKSNIRSPKRPEVFDFSAKGNTSEMSFEEKIKSFMQDSDEKISILRRNTDSKRKSSYRRSSSANI